MKFFFCSVYFGFCLLLFSASAALGQESNPFFLTEQKQTLGISGAFNPRFVFERSPGLPVDIIYRRFNTQNQAFRARIGGAHSKVSEESGVFYDREWNSNLGLGIGYEWHHPINTRFTWYYGGELGVTYYWLDRDQAKPFVFEGVPQIQLNQSTIRTIELVLQGLGGINFQLNRKFFLIVEQSITLSSQNYDSIEFGDLIPINPPFDDNIGSSGFGEGVIKYNRVFFQTSLGIHFKF